MSPGSASSREQAITIVTPTFHPEKIGTPHYVTDLVRELSSRDLPVRVVTAQPFYPRFERFDGYGRSTRFDEFEGVPVYRVPTIVPREGAPVWRLITQVNFLVQVLIAVALGRVPKARTVIAVSPGSPVAVLASRFLAGVRGRRIVLVHDIAFGLATATGGRIGRLFSGVVRRFEVGVMNGADAVAVLSPQMADKLRDVGVTRNIEVVPLWATVPADLSDEDPDRLVLYSGNLGRKQGVEVLLDLADVLEDRAPGAEVVIRGDGTQRDALVRSARARGLGNVRFEPFVPVEDLAGSLRKAAVHVVPLLPEGSAYAVPSKVFNILAVGRPVVAAAEPGSPLATLANEIQAIRCVPPGSVEEFAAEVCKLLDHPEERDRLGEIGRRSVRESYSRGAATDRLLQLLRDPVV